MRSSAVFGALIATVACSLLVHGLQEACTCGNLGSGTNPCTCSKTVVKAAKLPKPTYYASPEEINDAAAARNGAVVLPSSSSNPIVYSNIVNGNANANANANGNGNGNGNANSYVNGAAAAAAVDVITRSGHSSKLYSNDDSIAYNDGSSVAQSKSDTITITGNNPAIAYAAVTTSNNPVKNDVGCGCSKQISKSVDLDDSADSNVNIAPSFTPIGDLCYPLPIDSRSGKLIVKTRVTPAYPGKIVCNTCNPAAPYEICINTQSGETTARMLSVATIGSDSASFGIPSIRNSLPIGGGSTGVLSVSGSGSSLETLGNADSGAFDGSSSVYNGAYNRVFGGARPQTQGGSFGTVFKKTGTFGGSASGAFAASRSGLFGNVDSGVFDRSSSSSSSSSSFGSNSGVYNGGPSFAYSATNSAARTTDAQSQYGRTSVVGGGSSNCFDDLDSDDTGEGPVDYSYPQMPADAVSLTLAYKNLRAPNVIYRQGKQFVPEDKLSFGHRTVPNDARNEQKIADIPEERLVTVDKPVVELKVAPPRTVVIGSYDEREEAKLAELEAIERESITREDVVDRVAESLLTYKDLGYAPVGSVYASSRSHSGTFNGEINDSLEEPCGPLGPPIPDYIPGSVIIQQKMAQDNFARSSIEDIGEKKRLGGACSN